MVTCTAVLIAVAAPAASRLGGYNRTAACLSRIGQMTAAFLTYSQDYDEGFPFVARMMEAQADPNETWLADWMGTPDPPAAIDSVCHFEEDDWPAEPNVPRSGLLFTYTGFEDLYRCPEFERVSDPIKAQGRFNYTRALWCRRWRIYREEIELYGQASSTWGGLYDIM